MPFFQPSYVSSERQFLNFLSELDQATSQSQQKQAPTQCARVCSPRQNRDETFTPRFDVTETPTTYELFGELPGLTQENLSIEFTDVQTIIVKGKTVRAGTTIPTPEPAVVEKETEKDNSDASSEKSHAATVEDEYDEADTPLAATPATTATAVSDKATPEPKKEEAPKPRFWVSERKVGSFARSFSFSKRIEHDGVQASLKDGVVHVVVPKVTKTGKIVVNVA